MSEQRTTYETTWYDVPVTCCSWCHFVQFEDDNHTDWCNRDAAAARATADPEQR